MKRLLRCFNCELLKAIHLRLKIYHGFLLFESRIGQIEPVKGTILGIGN